MKFRPGVYLLGLSFFISALLRVPYFQHPFTFVDEAWWANGSKVLLEGGRLYRDVWLDKQPPIFLFCTFLFDSMGPHMDAIHFGSLFLAFVVSTLLFCIGASFFSPLVGGWAALIYALASTTYYTPRIIGMNSESLMVVFTTAAMYCFLQGVVRGRAYWLLPAGFVSALATVTKPVAITQIALFVGLFLLLPRKQNLVRRIRSLVFLADGYLCGLFLFVAYLISEGTLELWWEQAISYSLHYVSRVDNPAFIRKLFKATALFGLIYTWLLLLIWKGRETIKKGDRAYWVISCWILSAFAGVALGRRFYANYFIQVMPPMALLGAVGIFTVLQNLAQRRNRVVLRISSLAFLVMFAWFHSRTLAHWYFVLAPQSHQEVKLWGMCAENRSASEIGQYIKSKTHPSERIFVWGSKPELYFLSERPMATHYMEYDVGAEVPKNASKRTAQTKVLRTLYNVRPRYIIDVQRNARLENFPQFRKFVKQEYYLEAKLHDALLYRRRDSVAFRPEEIDLNSLVDGHRSSVARDR